ncbi:inositol 2-dehydrogenase [Nakamurella flava]|uniref:Inositol 2-dehydrogenase n=1 Tax=Nakamurella flava TaxID=2576308 RepID=A0A4U6QGH0_9ACTN|nr:Gfo/Idh/MocA family oxidoreductase [Nakamurella flava]TKV59198.1 inositol 2-dehydrogenase [Nakamurella flava]
MTAAVAPVRVGVIGTGIMGADHARNLHRFVSGAVIAAVTDWDADRAAAVAAEIPGCRVLTDGFAIIADADVDAVLIASADHTHAELVLAAIAAGKPVLCEKPLAPTVAECITVVQAEQDALRDGRIERPVVTLGFMRRFDPGYVQLRDTLRSGAIGTPLLVHHVSRGVSSGPGATSESSVTGSSVHEFDIVPWLLGSPIVEVSWHSGRPTAVSDFQDPQLLHLRTADGVLTVQETFLNARYGYVIGAEVVGETGTAVLPQPAAVVTGGNLSVGHGLAADWRPRFADAYRLELQEWVDAIIAGRESTLATARDGLVAAVVSDAVIASMHAGGAATAVALPDVAS